MKHHARLTLFLLALCLAFCSCRKDSNGVAVQTTPSAQDVLKIGTSWIYEYQYYDSTGQLLHSGPSYYDTVTISRDTVINNQKWFITFTNNLDGMFYFVEAVGLSNGEYWKMLRGRGPYFDTVATSPIFKLHANKGDSFECINCILTSQTEIVYKRTVMNTDTSITAGMSSYECVYLKETKIVPDHVHSFEYQNYFYSPVYGLIKNEYYKKTSGGMVYLQSVQTLKEVKIPH